MSTIKVDTYQTRGGVSEIAIDKLKGVTAAGSMLVVGEGGSTTTNLQQGLGKAWCRWNMSGTAAIEDSFNMASLTDVGTGISRLAFANDFSNTKYSATFGVGELDGGGNRLIGVRGSGGTGPTAGDIGIVHLTVGEDANDINCNNSVFHGDLA